MHRLLIPLLACLFMCAPALLRAQVPHEIQYLPFDQKKLQATNQSPDAPCGSAGTYTFGQFIGSSNDVAPPPIYLCFGDSLLVQHNGDADLSGDPNGLTTPGVAFGFYTCPPYADGPTLQDIIGANTPPPDPDSCLLPGSANGMYITQAVPNGGSTWFFNNGTLQTNFNSGQPMSIIYAPITVDDFAANNFESIQVGFPPGPCVAVNTAAAFEVVYLNEITATGITNNYDGNDCLGRFTIRGGLPQYDNTTVYTISIVLASNPAIKAVIHTSANILFHLASVPFSVPQSGLYTVTVEDGKSCPATFQIDMQACDPTDNLTISFPDTIVQPGASICVPVTVENFALLSAAFSVEWDESVLQYNSVQNVSSVIDTVFGPANLNSLQVANGFLGVSIFNNINPTALINIPNDSVLFEICFTAIGQLGECSGLAIVNTPTSITLENDIGLNLALTVDTGQVCIAFLPLEFSVAVIDTNCLGQATLVVTPFGGVEPYEVIVNEMPPTGPTYSGVVANANGMFTVMNVGSTNNTPVTYDICVQDNNGSGATQCTTIVVNIQRLGAQLNFAQQPLCNGDNNGIINAVVLQGGVIVPNPGTNYTYAWAPANLTVQGSLVQNGVPAGSFTVTVTDPNTQCSEVASGTLGQPAPLSSQSVTTIPAACSGVCNGLINYDAEGGVPLAGGAYQYTWTNLATGSIVGSGSSDPILLNQQCAGDYQIIITDANQCTSTEVVTLTDVRALSITTNATGNQNVLCNGGSTGSISITVVESFVTNNPYTFAWTAPGFTQVDATPVSTYSGLPVGTYSVTATDNIGCKISDTFDITQLPVLVIDSVGQTNPGCDQPNSGSASIIVLGGTGFGTYTFAWGPPPAVPNTQNQNNVLSFGTYVVTVTDANMCTATQQFNIPEPAPPIVTLTTTTLKCGGDGALEAFSPTGFIYVWTDINGFVIDSLPKIDSLDGGDYVIQVWDATGCVAYDTVNLASVTAMSFSNFTLMEPSCFGLNDGQIAIGVQDGQPPYVNYTWNPAPPPPQNGNSPVIFNLVANTYSVTVTDNVGCTLVGSFILGEPPAITNTFDLTVNGQVSCFGIVPCDGDATAITVYSDGSTGIFTYLWNDGGSGAVRTDLCAGPVSVIISDPNSCFILDTVLITTPPEITFSNLTTTETLCFGGNTGTASITATGGNGGPYMYLWSTGATTQNISGLSAGIVTVTLTDKNGCTNSIDTINIGEPDPILLSTSTTDPTCFGSMNGQTDVDVLGGVPGYTYVWANASGANVGNTAMADMLTAGTYDVTVTDANNCTSVASATIIDPPPVVGSLEPLAPLTCFGDETTLNILSITGGSGGPYRFSVDFGAVLDPNFPVTIGGGQHFITYIDVKDCAITDSLFVAEPTPITVSFNPDVIEVELGATADLEPIITGAAVIGGFTWTNPQALLYADTLNATAYTFSNISYTLTVMDTFGCSGSGTVVVNVDPNRNVYIPNAFVAANPSGLNDHFNINVGLGVEIVNFFRVYDRWGEMVYQREKFLPENDNLSEGWDGRYKSDFVNPGVFIYIAEVKFLDGRVLLYRGDVTVFR